MIPSIGVFLIATSGSRVTSLSRALNRVYTAAKLLTAHAYGRLKDNSESSIPFQSRLPGPGGAHLFVERELTSPAFFSELGWDILRMERHEVVKKYPRTPHLPFSPGIANAFS